MIKFKHRANKISEALGIKDDEANEIVMVVIDSLVSTKLKKVTQTIEQVFNNVSFALEPKHIAFIVIVMKDTMNKAEGLMAVIGRKLKI